jgi:hypothetical protein
MYLSASAAHIVYNMLFYACLLQHDDLNTLHGVCHRAVNTINQSQTTYMHAYSTVTTYIYLAVFSASYMTNRSMG